MCIKWTTVTVFVLCVISLTNVHLHKSFYKMSPILMTNILCMDMLLNSIGPSMWDSWWHIYIRGCYVWKYFICLKMFCGLSFAYFWLTYCDITYMNNQILFKLRLVSNLMLLVVCLLSLHIQLVVLNSDVVIFIVA